MKPIEKYDKLVKAPETKWTASQKSEERLTNQWWFSVVCTLINTDFLHRSGQSAVDSRGAELKTKQLKLSLSGSKVTARWWKHFGSWIKRNAFFSYRMSVLCWKEAFFGFFFLNRRTNRDILPVSNSISAFPVILFCWAISFLEIPKYVMIAMTAKVPMEARPVAALIKASQ